MNVLTLLFYVASFLFALGVLVTVHEFGHYWVAKTLGVKILRFSIGFGAPLVSWRLGKDQTEFGIAPIPLGGYVQMLDESEGEVAEAERHRAFNRQPLWIRSAVVLAGPMFNFLFAIAAYTAVYLIGITSMKAVIGDVEPNSIAARAGLQSGYEVVQVDHQDVYGWRGVIQASLDNLLDERAVLYRVNSPEHRSYDVVLDTTSLSLDDLGQGQFFDKIGLKPYQIPIPAIVEAVVAGSRAEQGGLQAQDKVIRINGENIDSWQRWAALIQQHPEQALDITVERDGKEVSLRVVPEDHEGKGLLGVQAVRSYSIPDQYLVIERYSFLPALLKGVEETWFFSTFTLRAMWQLVTLQLSHKNISGPITIAEFAGKSAHIGIVSFLMFLSMVSITLGVMNLLPIPMLDGGHLLFYLIEAVKGSPISERVQYVMFRVGIFLVLCLMSLALFNDFERLFG